MQILEMAFVWGAEEMDRRMLANAMASAFSSAYPEAAEDFENLASPDAMDAMVSAFVSACTEAGEDCAIFPSSDAARPAESRPRLLIFYRCAILLLLLLLLLMLYRYTMLRLLLLAGGLLRTSTRPTLNLLLLRAYV
jgi:hypothetical protein